MQCKFLVLVAVAFVMNAQAQNVASKIDVRLGIGSSILGTGDMVATMIENELNIKLNNYFTLAGSVAFAKSNSGIFIETSFIQANANLYFSPFKNNKRNDFRIGTGLSWYSVSDVFSNSYNNPQSGLAESRLEIETRTAFGFNIIVENTYAVTDRFQLGLKLFTQPYIATGDINSGLLLKFGFNL